MLNTFDSVKAAFDSTVDGPSIFATMLAKIGTFNPVTAAAHRSPPPAPPSQPPGIVKFDFDGDGKADIGRWHSGNSEFKVKNSNGGSYSTFTLGATSAVSAPGDFNGDGQTDAAVFNAGTWTYKTSPSAGSQTISFGSSGDRPVAGDYDGDGITDAAIYRPSTGTWWISMSSGGYSSTAFGLSSDIPVVGNFDGDTKNDIAVFRPSTGYWHVLGSTSGYFATQWGMSTDIPAAADFDGDGRTDLAIYRPSTGTWWILKSSDNTYYAQTWGNYGDQPAPADYDGDGKADFSVWRPTTGVWYTIKTSDSSYSYQSLGVSGDTAIPSSYLRQIGGTVAADQLLAARLSPKNATGGTNLYSRNFSWGTSLAGLPGRSGLDAGIGISYNSLVWTKVGSSMVFDADNSNVSPGFRLGFPTIEPTNYDEKTGHFSYLMVTPIGGRVEFRQTAASDTYETADGSYVQLKTVGASSPNDPVENITINVTSTDGTQSAYEWKGGAYRCQKITDRNGNYITINHDEQGVLRTVTDTLGRALTVNYDAELYPISITQTWKDNNGTGSNVTHTWASFAYTSTNNPSINTSFGSLNFVGPPNGTTLKVLERVTYADGSWTKFTYNSYAQIYKIQNFAPDDHELNRVRNDLESPAANQTDCPRFSQTWNFVENFNGGSETTVTNSVTAGAGYALPGSISGMATKIEVAMNGDPYNSVTKMFVGESGWREGLPIATEDWADGAGGLERKRWTWNDWTQDDDNLTYILNPRTIESRVGDTSNVKRTTTEYLTYPMTQIAQYGLVRAANVYDTDLSTVLKRVETDYDLSAAYTSRRIIGLPTETRAFGYETTGLNLMSKTTYGYDEGTFGDSTLGQNISPVQHDDTNFGSGFIVGRGNVTSTTRHDVLGQSAAVNTSVKYNTAGAVVSQTDPMSRTVRIGYADNFSTAGNPAGYAYPTTLTDPAGNSSTVKYRYDIGANVEAVSPAPAGNAYGKKTRRIYDVMGRLQRDSVYMDTTEYAYSRFEYPANGVQSKRFTTIVDVGGDGPDASDEVLSESWSDGAGRVRQSRTEHPGSTGGYSGTLVEYDILGRVKRQSVPTEIDSNWSPAGDDQARGWLWMYQKYDWKGRVVRKINTDGIDSPTLNDSDVLISYEGCGCAGGQVTTVQGESVPRDDQPAVNARRTQKVYEDILGRAFKTVVMNWDGTTAYTTTEQSFNGRDQVVNTRQTDNTSTASPQTHQDVSVSYDGNGRMKTRHYPIEDAQTETTWNYNADDSVSQVIDPRGAITNFTYNSRGLTSQIAYDPPATQPTNTTIPDTPTVTFSYDGLGNRTAMSDGSGTHAYAYDPLSRLTSETQSFIGLTGNFTTGYTYQISGKLKSVTDAFGADVFYNDDRAGRTTSITGADFLNVATYASNIKFRAFGGVKELTMGNSDGSVVSYEFDNRLRVSGYQSTSSVVAGGYVRKAAYEYLADGMVKKVDNLADHRFDQNYKYDFAGRLKSSDSGTVTNSNNEQVKTYSQAIAYDAFGEMTSRTTGIWGSDGGFEATYQNGRKQNSNELYDAGGNVVDKTTSATVYERWKFDAAGRSAETKMRWRVQIAPQATTYDKTEWIQATADGDGRVVKRLDHKESVNLANNQTSVGEAVEYYLTSTPLKGRVLTELDSAGAKRLTNVYTGGGVLAQQRNFPADADHSQPWSEVFWRHEDLITRSYTSTIRDGTKLNAYDPPSGIELEPLGGEIPNYDPNIPDETYVPRGLRTFRFAGDVNQPEYGCVLNGGPLPCTLLPELTRGRSQVRYGTTLRGFGENNNTRFRAVHHSWETPDPKDIPDNPNTPEDETVIGVGSQGDYYEFVVDGAKVALSGKLIQRIQRVVNDLIGLKPSEDCQKNVIDKLTAKLGFSIEDFQAYLKKGFNAYDGKKTTALAAGNLRDKKTADSMYGPGAIISERFKTNRISKIVNGKVVWISRQINAETSMTADILTIYFRPSSLDGSDNDNRAFLFHEALHGFLSDKLGRTDPDIQRALGLSEDEPTKNISDYIRKYCFSE